MCASIHNIQCTHTQTHTWNHTALILIETPFKVDSSGLSVDVENYCSDPTTPCTIKTPSSVGSVQVYLSLVATKRTCIQTCRQNCILQKAFSIHMYCISRKKVCMYVAICGHLHASFACAHQHAHAMWTWTRVHKNTTLLLWSSLTLTNIPWNRGVYGPTIGWQRSVVTSLSLTGSVLNHNHTITARRPGARWACHYPGHKTNITPVLSLYIYARGASNGAWAVKVYFWMYSLHSERVAVGARQLWRQRVIVARQPDRPKMAELTGTGKQTTFTLVLGSLWQV